MKTHLSVHHPDGHLQCSFWERTFWLFLQRQALSRSGKHCTVGGVQGQPGSPVQLFLDHQGLQATFLLFQNFERVQQTSSHLVGLAPLKMLIMQEKVSQYHICSLDHLFLSHHCSRLYCHWNQGAFAKCSSIDIYQRQLDF